MSTPTHNAVTLPMIRHAAARIRGHIIRTPLLFSEALSRQLGGAIYVKAENLQRTGAFKIRGASNLIALLTESRKADSFHLVAATTGNHGLGVAYAGRDHGIPCTIVMPAQPNAYKKAQIEATGAEVICHGNDSDQLYERVHELEAVHHYTLVHSFAHPDLIAGQGTIGLEILDDLPDVDEVYVGIGGGGLIAGIATAIKESRPATKVFGVEPTGARCMIEALQMARPCKVAVQTIADGLACAKTETLNLALVQRYVDDILTVTDAELRTAMRLLLEHAKLVVEPAGAAAIAAITQQPADPKVKRVAVLSGGNIDGKGLRDLLTANDHPALQNGSPVDG